MPNCQMRVNEVVHVKDVDGTILEERVTLGSRGQGVTAEIRITGREWFGEFLLGQKVRLDVVHEIAVQLVVD